MEFTQRRTTFQQWSKLLGRPLVEEYSKTNPSTSDILGKFLGKLKTLVFPYKEALLAVYFLPIQYFHWRTLSAETWLDLLFHLHLSVHSCRSRQSTGNLPRRPLLVCQQGCRATQSTCVPPRHLMTRTSEVGAKGSRHPWDWNVHTQSSLLCRLCAITLTMYAYNEEYLQNLS